MCRFITKRWILILFIPVAIFLFGQYIGWISNHKNNNHTIFVHNETTISAHIQNNLHTEVNRTNYIDITRRIRSETISYDSYKSWKDGTAGSTTTDHSPKVNVDGTNYELIGVYRRRRHHHRKPTTNRHGKGAGKSGKGNGKGLGKSGKGNGKGKGKGYSDTNCNYGKGYSKKSSKKHHSKSKKKKSGKGGKGKQRNLKSHKGKGGKGKGGISGKGSKSGKGGKGKGGKGKGYYHYGECDGILAPPMSTVRTIAPTVVNTNTTTSPTIAPIVLSPVISSSPVTMTPTITMDGSTGPTPERGLLRIVVPDWYIAYRAPDATTRAPTREEYDMILEATRIYIEQYFMEYFAMNNLDMIYYIDTESVLTTASYGTDVPSFIMQPSPIDDGRYNIYVHFRHVTFVYYDTSTPDPPNEMESYTLLEMAITTNPDEQVYISQVPQSLTGTPFESTIDIVFGRVP